MKPLETAQVTTSAVAVVLLALLRKGLASAIAGASARESVDRKGFPMGSLNKIVNPGKKL